MKVLSDNTDELAYKELKAENQQLKNEISDKDDEIAGYADLVNVLTNLLSAEKQADNLQHKSGCGEAYEIYYALRDATARIHQMVYG